MSEIVSFPSRIPSFVIVGIKAMRLNGRKGILLLLLVKQLHESGITRAHA